MFPLFDFESRPKQFLSISLLHFLFLHFPLLIYWFLLKLLLLLFFSMKHFKSVCCIGVLVLLAKNAYSYVCPLLVGACNLQSVNASDTWLGFMVVFPVFRLFFGFHNHNQFCLPCCFTASPWFTGSVVRGLLLTLWRLCHLTTSCWLTL